ncbi:hypothetical protein DTO166G4_5648 [Paecilomyces variotii]|nr:hypothetical protein DTO166G4_5648 [Paecilomyces variotii]KAJ9222506.1 hypothetical protein DTO169C6_5246 [Paecilomyces variotii]KAJ9236020.1 hypothetical protein DTO166G5_4312 [Paecilomyces variotii]KAJ9368162.1 hypothetical protein DTO282E5_7131 [Paecilomyces variotii]KAJ9397028.1 hypothetical protein DTO282F9_6124 [Paecilomyces variotii]
MPSSNLNFPASPHTVQVSIIDSTSKINAPSDRFLQPRIDGFDRLLAPAFSFLVENQRSGRKVLFDLGVRKDWENLAKPLYEAIKDTFKVEVEKDVAQILRENGVKLEDVEGIIWSHWHFDHIGDPSTFPGSTSLIVGPGMPAAKLPGYPKDPNGAVRESDFEGRQLIEITQDKFDLRIGGFSAYDYFGDGSFYLLDVPGHAVGHMCGLARTTSSSGKDTFILMGADTCHHGGQFRPSPHLPLPDSIIPNPYSSQSTPCPGHIFEYLHPHPERYRTEPFYRIRVNEDGSSVADNVAAATQSIAHLQEFDAADDVFIVLAHDASLLGVIDVYPNTANEWKEKGWKDRGRWRFLRSWDIASDVGVNRS